MHYLHTLVSLIERLAKGDPVMWTLFVGFVIVLGIAFVYDLCRGERKGTTRLKQNNLTENAIRQHGVPQLHPPPQPDLPANGDTEDSAS
jgi:hypothetical protein